MDQQNNRHAPTGQTDRPLIILGYGYTGRHIMQLTLNRGTSAWATSRNPALQLAAVPFPQRLEFDLARPETWEHLPTGADLIWCFPAAPLSAIQIWAKMQHSRINRLVVLSSTSAYQVSDHSTEYPPPWIDESAPIDMTKPRVQGEEYLRNELDAIVLRVAGIYGPGRNPLDWIRQGRVGPSRKYVNLIHVEDLAEICLAALVHGKPGEAYNVSDGTPHTWNEICVTAQQRWGVTAGATKEDRSWGKRISNAKLRSELDYRFRHSDLYEALDLIGSTRSRS
ncbi:MAG: NAD(P)H-binding protein [Nitrospiraceae bacterium]|nr:NAD(P)H-binding protein [Nitrospiraceae bacterium]